MRFAPIGAFKNQGFFVGCIEHFHKVWLIYTECDLNVTRAPSVGPS